MCKTGVTIDDIYFWESENKAQRMENVGLMIVGERAEATLRGAEWVMQMHLVPLVVLLEADQGAADILLSRGYRLFAADITSGGDTSVAVDLIRWARSAHELDQAKARRHEILSWAKEEGSGREILAIKTK